MGNILSLLAGPYSSIERPGSTEVFSDEHRPSPDSTTGSHHSERDESMPVRRIPLGLHITTSLLHLPFFGNRRLSDLTFT